MHQALSGLLLLVRGGCWALIFKACPFKHLGGIFQAYSSANG
jgi:hypothetical protein